MNPLVSVLTVYGQWNPFKELQRTNLKRFTSVEFEHLTIQGGDNGSYSHGSGLDELTSRARGRYVLSLDADAFPVAPWDGLIRHLDTHDAVAIHHPRFEYGHPSFFLSERSKLRGRSWQRKGHKDVGRELSDNLNSIFFLRPTSWFAENIDPLDPQIGAVYDDKVFHNWYTSRSRKKANPDGISNDIIDRAVADALERFS